MVLHLFTGAVQSALAVPTLLTLRERLPGCRVRVGVTPAAQRFVTVDSLRAFGASDIIHDDWDAAFAQEHHVDLTRDVAAYIVYPATLNYVAKLASGLALGPAMLALQTTSAPVVICPAFPEGALGNPIVTANLRRLSERTNVRVMPTTRGVSAWSGREFEGAACDISAVAAAVREMMKEQELSVRGDAGDR